VSVGAIVLSAGKSERMGRQKALLPYRGRTFIENILDAISKSSVSDVVTVLGHHAEAIRNAVPSGNFVMNPDYEEGMITSIQAGIRALNPNVEGALLFLVDHPVVSSRTVDALIHRFEPGRIILPTYQGRRGHPVLFARDVLNEILELPMSAGANTVVRKDPQRIIEVVVDDAGVTIDVDTPEQFEGLS
jgi:molybdenum cofactor cytidylyltransferase